MEEETMNKKAILAMTVAVLVTACLVSAAGIAAEVRPSTVPADVSNDDVSDVAAALALRLETEVGAEVNAEIIDDVVQMAASRRATRGATQGAVLTVAAVEEMTIVNHGDEASMTAWDGGWVCPGDWEAHYFPPWMVPNTFAHGALVWDDADNDMDLYMITFAGFDWAWWSGSPLVEFVGPVPTTQWPWGNGGVTLLVNHWGGTSCQNYVVTVDSHWW
jgi:hypothetical protein